MEALEVVLPGSAKRGNQPGGLWVGRNCERNVLS